jgi:hypothetical protein
VGSSGYGKFQQRQGLLFFSILPGGETHPDVDQSPPATLETPGGAKGSWSKMGGLNHQNEENSPPKNGPLALNQLNPYFNSITRMLG